MTKMAAQHGPGRRPAGQHQLRPESVPGRKTAGRRAMSTSPRWGDGLFDVIDDACLDRVAAGRLG